MLSTTLHNFKQLALIYEAGMAAIEAHGMKNELHG